MTGRVYREYQRDRVGWFFGLTGVQLGLLTTGSLPVFWTAHVGWWSAAFVALVGWMGLVVLVVVPVRGRSAVGWAAASLTFGVARLFGRTAWGSALAYGRAAAAEVPDLPPPLDQICVHHAQAPADDGVAVVEDPTRRTWTVVARMQHGGLDWLTGEERDQRGAGLAALLDAACRTEVVSEVQVLVRACPDSGAEREYWLTEHRSHAEVTPRTSSAEAVGAEDLVRTVHDDLRRHLTAAATRTEAFLILVVPETRLRRQVRQDRLDRSGTNPLDARLRLVRSTAAEVGQLAQASLGVQTDWLTSSALAEACRAGFHLDADTALADARAAVRAAAPQAGGGVEVDVPWPAAGPAHTETHPQSYAHDGWQSASMSVLLPPRGAVLGALAPVLAPWVAGERRCLLVAFPVMTATVADRVTASREWAADLGDGLRTRAGVRPRAKTRADHATARGVDAKLVAGAALCRPYAIATTTVPLPNGQAEASVGDAVRRLEASVRRAGFAAQRLDLAHDTAFAAGCVPLGHTFSRTGSTGRAA